jgi:hypothetical protein
MKTHKEKQTQTLEDLLESLDEDISTRQIHLENEKIEVSMFLSLNKLRGLRADYVLLESSLKNLTAAIPRFIAKLTKEPCPLCTEAEVGRQADCCVDSH